MSWLSRLFGSLSIPPKVEQKLTDIQRFVVEDATSLMHVINESIEISNNSTNPETKVSRIEVARAKLDLLVLLSQKHSFLNLQRLDAVRKTIADLSNEYSEAGYYAKSDQTCRDYRQDVWKNISVPIDDIGKGWRFGATMQLRTPMRVLSRHGEFHNGLDDPPSIAKAQWEGYWTPVLKSNKELGIDVPEIVLSNPTTASDIGQIPVDGGEYLKFLLKVRTIVESYDSIESRRNALFNELTNAEWQDFCRKLGGNKFVSDLFFPPFIQTIKGIPGTAVAVLLEKGLTTPENLAATSDSELLAVKGIGKAKLTAIREACASIQNQDSEFVDTIER